MADRKKIKEITITLEGGQTITRTPDQVSAIFLNWDSIEQILVPFYKNNNREMTDAQVEKEFGKKAKDKVFQGTKGYKKIDESFIATIWNTEGDTTNETPALIEKRPECIIGGDGGI